MDIQKSGGFRNAIFDAVFAEDADLVVQYVGTDVRFSIKDPVFDLCLNNLFSEGSPVRIKVLPDYRWFNTTALS